MNGFSLHLQSATQYERLDDIVSFVGEDSSGSFALMSNHARFITTLVFGLAKFRYGGGEWQYLALPGAVAYFHNNQLTLSTRRYLRSDDYTQISRALREELVVEEQALGEFKQSLAQMEKAMMLRLWRMGRGEMEKI